MPTQLISVSQDSWINNFSPSDSSGGADTSLYAGYIAGLEQARIILGPFDMSTIPLGSTIDSALLKATVNNWDSDGTDRSLRFARMRRSDWVEAEASWQLYKAGSTWTTGGASNVVTDIDLTDSFLVTAVETTGNWNIYSGTELVALLQDAMDNRGRKLFLWIAMQNLATNSYIAFDSREGGTPFQVSVTYTAPEPPPAPSVVGRSMVLRSYYRRKRFSRAISQRVIGARSGKQRVGGT